MLLYCYFLHIYITQVNTIYCIPQHSYILYIVLTSFLYFTIYKKICQDPIKNSMFCVNFKTLYNILFENYTIKIKFFQIKKKKLLTTIFLHLLAD